MPLSTPTARTLSHTRRVTCHGYKRADGLWDIEAHMIDTKTHDLELYEHENGILPAGEALHEMSIRITVDLDLNILDAEAVMDNHPLRICPSIAERYKLLKGLQIAPGFTRKTKELFGGTSGCTHLLELLGPLATTAFQSTHKEREAAMEESTGSAPPPVLNGCHALAEYSPAVKEHWPQYYNPQPGEKNN
ncbi:DUF2889 domain-containing protein [Marinobacterium mangrovicola]|uniref:DUF2889 family protein n=1 Tax=Marinobacterium mangrovicola TaxID=1476959 RepID=A0A4R1GPL6_9GAMM|nr:DUF2889 domain-containing protein [Marinobacterium mangrovicola]TCK08935.1 Protein of unknown function (DUF2889) [Marinobacterium mangrovicola]